MWALRQLEDKATPQEDGQDFSGAWQLLSKSKSVLPDCLSTKEFRK